jgi:hypothetical protein
MTIWKNMMKSGTLYSHKILQGAKLSLQLLYSSLLLSYSNPKLKKRGGGRWSSLSLVLCIVLCVVCVGGGLSPPYIGARTCGLRGIFPGSTPHCQPLS